jgi:hypothetical protein
MLLGFMAGKRLAIGLRTFIIVTSISQIDFDVFKFYKRFGRVAIYISVRVVFGDWLN